MCLPNPTKTDPKIRKFKNRWTKLKISKKIRVPKSEIKEHKTRKDIFRIQTKNMFLFHLEMVVEMKRKNLILILKLEQRVIYRDSDKDLHLLQTLTVTVFHTLKRTKNMLEEEEKNTTQPASLSCLELFHKLMT